MKRYLKKRAAVLCLAIIAISAQALAGTAPSQGASSYTFVMIGDNRSCDRIYHKIQEALMRRHPEFVINVGDVIAQAGNREDWAHFRESSRTITVPYYLATGNHDVEDEHSAQVWSEEVKRPGPEMYYSFTRGPDLFVVLDSNEPGNEHRISGRQLDWLTRTLDAEKYRHQFVFLHHPFFLWKGVTHYGESMDQYPEERDALHRLFVERGVNMVFSGHVHLYRRIEKDGVTYIISGGAGQPLYAKGSKMSFHNFVALRVDGGRISAQVYDVEGALRDEFVLKDRAVTTSSR